MMDDARIVELFPIADSIRAVSSEVWAAVDRILASRYEWLIFDDPSPTAVTCDEATQAIQRLVNLVYSEPVLQVVAEYDDQLGEDGTLRADYEGNDPAWLFAWRAKSLGVEVDKFLIDFQRNGTGAFHEDLRKRALRWMRVFEGVVRRFLEIPFVREAARQEGMAALLSQTVPPEQPLATVNDRGTGSPQLSLEGSANPRLAQRSISAAAPAERGEDKPATGTERRADLLTTDELALLAEVGKERFLNVLSAARTSGEADLPVPAVRGSGSRNDQYSYAAIRPFLLRKWPRKAVFFPESFADVGAILANRN